jgi:hypothetical protein
MNYIPAYVCACATLFLATDIASATPFPTRDQNPLLAGFGVPMPLPARIGDERDWSLATDFNWASSALVQRSGAEALVVDAETREVRLTLHHAISDRFAVHGQVPYRYTGGGTLDGLIDNFHDVSGTPSGDRSDLPSDQIHIAYTRFGTTQLNITSSARGLGDLQAGIGWMLAQTSASALTTWLDIKLPTGDGDKLTGSGATDVSLAIAGERELTSRWSTFGQASVTWLGEGDLLTSQQRSVLWSGLAGIEWQAWRNLSLKMQIDAHSAAFDSDLNFLGAAPLVLTAGGDYRLRSGWLLDFGLSEDISVEASPDVVFVFGVRRALR